MKNIGVIGSGTMGVGIAQVAASNGCNVKIFDVNTEQTTKSLDHLKNQLQKLVDKGKWTSSQMDEVLNRILPITTLAEFHDSDCIIEAIIEDKTIKQRVFSDLEKIVRPDCILASNTSSISITSLSSELQYSDRFIGIHFFNPAPLMQLVEIIPGLLTKEELPQKMMELMSSWKKLPVIVKDIPGFLVNRIARPFYGEALRIVEENIADVFQVDLAMKMIGKFKMGPFELMDLIGIDVNFSVTKTVYQDYFFDPKYKPSLLQQRMVEAKLLGRKASKGFYEYGDDIVLVEPIIDSGLFEKIFLRIISMLVNEAVEAKRLQLASDEAIDTAMLKGVNYPKGLLVWGEEIGWAKISETLQKLYDLYGEERYRQSPLLKELAGK